VNPINTIMREIEDYFHLGGDYKWQCPHCEVGLLKIDKEKFQQSETKKSTQSEENAYGEKEFTEYLFNGILNCNHCLDIVTITGYGDLANYNNPIKTQSNSFNPEVDWVPITVDRFFPLYFHPSINIFDVSKKCPKNIREVIISSFKLFWSDKNASANKVRIAIEKIIEDININTKISKKPLGDKISNSNVLPDKVKDYFLAIKWIGNSGSHKELNVSKNDIIDAYKLLEKSISILYEKDIELIKITKEINKKKGPRNK
jgi:hypothetical protein